ncbi:hypothetical protein AB0D45_00115 [Streptomyces sp. NPDC048352]|uniref:hypothetical protein n=1 Tax=Streptomyces sp. NPDC048352 TaxID=3154718 RepID=UPI003437AFAE
MNTPNASQLPVVAAMALLAATTMATAATAAPSLHYKCSSSTKSIDDAAYSGPWPDNWDMTLQVCAARSGATVYTYADVRWDGPAFYATSDATIFDGAKIRVQIMQSRQGTDPVVAEQDFPLKARLEKATPRGDRDGSHRTPVISHRAGGGAYGNAVVFLDWHKDGHGYQAHDFKASPSL